MADPVAIYGAAVATAGVAWQVAAHVRATRTKLEVAVAGGWDGRPTPETHYLVVIVVNHGRHDVPMPHVDVLQPSIRRSWPITAGDLLAPLPDTLVARSSAAWRVTVSRFLGLRFPHPVIATAWTATGEQFWSEPVVIGHLPDQPPPEESDGGRLSA